MRRGGSARNPPGRVNPGNTLPTGNLQHPEQGAGTRERRGSQSYGREALGAGLTGGGYADFDGGQRPRSSSREGRPQGWHLRALPAELQGFLLQNTEPCIACAAVMASLWQRAAHASSCQSACFSLPQSEICLLCISGLQHSNTYRGTEGCDLGSRRSGGWRDVEGPQSPVRSQSYGAFERRSSESNSHQFVSPCCGLWECSSSAS